MNLIVYHKNRKIDELNLYEELSGDLEQKFEAYIGRASHCVIQIDDHLISREQASISYEKGEWKISPLAKNDKLTINGQFLESERIVNEGDDILLGEHRIQIDQVTIPEAFQEIIIEDEVEEVPPEPVEAPPENIIEEEVAAEEPAEEEEFSFDEEETPDEQEEYSEEEESYQEEAEFDSGDEFEASDDFESDDGFDDDYALEEAGEKTAVFTGFANYTLEIFGEFAPFERYGLKEGENFIGRDSKTSQIPLTDPEVSSQHAVIIKHGGSIELKDLESGNGTLLNGVRIIQEQLKSGDEFIIGSTTFTLRVTSDFLKQEKDRLLPVEENQVVEIEEVIEVDELSDDTGGKKDKGADLKGLNKIIWDIKQLPPKKRLIYGLGAIGLLFFLLDGGEEKVVVKKKPKNKNEKKLDENGNVISIGGKELTPEEQKLAKLSIEEREFLVSTYQLGFEFIQQGKYAEAKRELDKVAQLVPEYKQTQSLIQIATEGFRKLEELEKKRLKEIEEKKRQERVNKLVEKAKELTKERNEGPAKAVFNQILSIDPENLDVPQLKMELDAWRKDKERKALEKAEKEADRKRKLSQIAPSRTYYGKEEWYSTILKVEEFLKIKDMDEDLVKEATNMLKVSKDKIKSKTSPILGKARSLKEGQDLKGAYEQFMKVLDFDPVNTEALDEMENIRETLKNRSKKIYREGLISESLQLFSEAKEKYQEVQQISPIDSEYYIKATNKLREYLE